MLTSNIFWISCGVLKDTVGEKQGYEKYWLKTLQEGVQTKREGERQDLVPHQPGALVRTLLLENVHFLCFLTGSIC